MKTMTKLQEEGGCTLSSLQNAKVLIAERGCPVKLDFRADTSRADYFVTATWANGSGFRFTGFSWGYGGTGCQGLNEFLQSIGVNDLNSWDVPIEEGKTEMTYTVKEPTPPQRDVVAANVKEMDRETVLFLLESYDIKERDPEAYTDDLQEMLVERVMDGEIPVEETL